MIAIRLAMSILVLITTTVLAQGGGAESLLQSMTPEERVGQLFLLTFEGSTLKPDDPILNLIRDNHISGVILRADNENFVGPEGTLETLSQLVTSLQVTEFEASLESEAGGGEPSIYVPLLVGLAQEGNGAEYSEIVAGISSTPSQMAIGATWDPALARATGAVLGEELSAVGINMLLGPSLDVLDNPGQLDLGDLGVRTFGGDPYWVGVLGKAFIEGVHAGSAGKIGVIAKYFPGLGGSDRPIDEEASTVRKSLIQLQQIELAPFFAVTESGPGQAPGIADGLLTGNIRYQGFQGNIRRTTRPIGLDPDAFGQLMALEPFARWREAGGITVSGPLGSEAIRRFNESLGQSFRGHLVARDAFLAGNDLLYISEFASDGDPDQLTTIQDTLNFFSEKYRDDAIFAQRVDEAVLRVLRFKLQLNGGRFDPEPIVPNPTALENVGDSNIALQVARAGATLLSPSADELAGQIGAAPQIGDRMVFISDVRDYAQCSNCDGFQHIGARELENTILSLYGTSAAGQVGAWNSISLTMADLALFLGEAPPSVPGVPLVPPEEVEALIRPADWLIFVTLKDDPDVFGSNALKKLLDDRPDLVRNKQVVVFGMDVPYDLGATDVSKIDVYYGLYGKTSSFVDVAARLLFQELSAPGASPVSVPGIRYDLIEVTSPNSDHLITLSIVGAEESAGGYSIGDVVEVATGVIYDHNGNPVPDGTPVEFVLSYQGEGPRQSISATTEDGVASIEITLDRLGVLTVEALSGPATVSEILQLNVQEGIVTVITPTAEATIAPEPSATPLEQTPTPEAVAQIEATPEPSSTSVGFGALALTIPGIVVVSALGYLMVAPENGGRLRLGLLMLIGGLVGYNYVALGIPGSEQIMATLGVFSGVVVASLTAAAVGVAGYFWLGRSAQGSPDRDEKQDDHNPN